MSESIGLQNCTTYIELKLSPETDPRVAEPLVLAAHRLVNAVVTQEQAGLLTKDEKKWALIKNMAQRDVIFEENVNPFFEEPKVVYGALMAAIEKPCEGDCSDCPLAAVDIVKKA